MARAGYARVNLLEAMLTEGDGVRLSKAAWALSSGPEFVPARALGFVRHDAA
jgi:hypothetical protein